MASVYTTNEFRKGLKVDIENTPYIIIEFQHVKPGKGNSFTRVRFKSLMDGRVLDQTLKSGDKVKAADTQERTMQYLYDQDNLCVFMDTATYEQLHIEKDKLEVEAPFMVENMELRVLFFNNKPVGVTLPTFVELKVAECDPGIKGDTVSGATKWATMETGFRVQVPLHISEGDRLRIDTREGGKYMDKVNK